jgi:rhomboid protease GluP
MIPAAVLFAVFYVFSMLYSGYRIGDYFWVSGAAVFSDHEYWRVITALFTHRDIVHLLSNALMFFVFGWVLKAYFGYGVFPAASLLIGIVTNIITVAVYDPDIRLIGASGMTYGMAALWIVMYIRFDHERRVPGTHLSGVRVYACDAATFDD